MNCPWTHFSFFSSCLSNWGGGSCKMGWGRWGKVVGVKVCSARCAESAGRGTSLHRQQKLLKNALGTNVGV